jgi:hypothetical protein
LEEQRHPLLVMLVSIVKHLSAQWEDSKEQQQWQQMLVQVEHSNEITSFKFLRLLV